MQRPSPFLLAGASLAAILTLVSCGGGGGGTVEDSGTDAFVFATATPDRYARIDRMGQPAVGTALLSRNNGAPVPLDGAGNPVNPGAGNLFNAFDNQRDAFNRGDPVNDARDFAFMLTRGPQTNALANIHFKLGPQMRALGLVPCSTETVVPPLTPADVDISVCVALAGPVILPDVITYNPNATPGWPNGRGFDDPVIDRLLAAALLRIGAPHTLDALVGTINATRDEAGTPQPATFPFLRTAYPSP
jgi:hypothetical protein